MIDLLVGNSSVVLQNIVILDPLCDCNPLGYGQHFRELIVGDIVQLCAVVLGDDEL